MAAPSEMYNRIRKTLSEASPFVKPEEIEPGSADLSDMLLQWISEFPVLWHPEEYKKPEYRKKYQEAWSSVFDILEECIPKKVMSFEHVNIPGAFYLDRHIFYQELLEEALGTKMPRMRLSKKYAFLKNSAPKKYSELIHLLNAEDDAKIETTKEELSLLEGDDNIGIRTEEAIAQIYPVLATESELAQEVPLSKPVDQIKPIPMVRRARTKLSRGKATTPQVKAVNKPSAKRAAPGTAQRITQIPSQSLLNWNKGLDYAPLKQFDNEIDHQFLLSNPFLSTEEQIQQLVNIECARALKSVKISRIPFVPNYATTDYFQKGVAHYAGKLFEEIILWNKYQEMENQKKRKELFDESLKSVVNIFPQFDVQEIVRGVPNEDESKQLSRPIPKKSLVDSASISKQEQPVSTDSGNFGFGKIGAFEQLGALGKKLTAAIAEPAKAVAQMTIDFVEAELNAMDRKVEAQLKSCNQSVVFDGEFVDLATDSKHDAPQKDDVEVASEAIKELNTYLQYPAEYENEDDWPTIRQSAAEFDCNRECVELVSSIKQKAAQEELKPTMNEGECIDLLTYELAESNMVENYSENVPELKSVSDTSSMKAWISLGSRHTKHNRMYDVLGSPIKQKVAQKESKPRMSEGICIDMSTYQLAESNMVENNKENELELETESDTSDEDVWNTFPLVRTRRVRDVLDSPIREQVVQEESTSTMSEGDRIDLSTYDLVEQNVEEHKPEKKLELERELEEVNKMFGGLVYKPLPTESDASDVEEDSGAPSDSGISDDDVNDIKGFGSHAAEPASFDELFGDVNWQKMPMPNGEEECDCDACLRLIKPILDQNNISIEDESEYSMTGGYSPDPDCTSSESSDDEVEETRPESPKDPICEDSIIPFDFVDSKHLPIIENEEPEQERVSYEVSESHPLADQIENIRQIVQDTSAEEVLAAMVGLSDDIDGAFVEMFTEQSQLEEFKREDPVVTTAEQAIAEKKDETSKPLDIEEEVVIEDPKPTTEEPSAPISELRLRSVAAASELQAAVKEKVVAKVKPAPATVAPVAPESSNRLIIIILLYVFTFFLMIMKFI